MTALDSLEETDTSNYALSKQALEKLEPATLQAVQAFVELLDAVSDSFGRRSNYDEFNETVSAWLEGLSGEPEANARRLESESSSSPDDPAFPQVQEAYNRAYSIIARSCLLLRLRRDFLFAVGDLLRLRVTSYLGLLRTQVEGAALLQLIAENPSLGTDWMNTFDQAAGKIFYRRHHGSVTERLRALDLYDFYEQGSAVSLHSRAAGVAPGVIAAGMANEPGTISLATQEITKAADLLAWVALLLRAHNVILKSLPGAFPECNFSSPEIDASVFATYLAQTTQTARLLFSKNAPAGFSGVS